MAKAFKDEASVGTSKEVELYEPYDRNGRLIPTTRQGRNIHHLTNSYYSLVVPEEKRGWSYSYLLSPSALLMAVVNAGSNAGDAFFASRGLGSSNGFILLAIVNALGTFLGFFGLYKPDIFKRLAQSLSKNTDQYNEFDSLIKALDTARDIGLPYDDTMGYLKKVWLPQRRDLRLRALLRSNLIRKPEEQYTLWDKFTALWADKPVMMPVLASETRGGVFFSSVKVHDLVNEKFIAQEKEFVTLLSQQMRGLCGISGDVDPTNEQVKYVQSFETFLKDLYKPPASVEDNDFDGSKYADPEFQFAYGAELKIMQLVRSSWSLPGMTEQKLFNSLSLSLRRLRDQVRRGDAKKDPYLFSKEFHYFLQDATSSRGNVGGQIRSIFEEVLKQEAAFQVRQDKLLKDYIIDKAGVASEEYLAMKFLFGVTYVHESHKALFDGLREDFKAWLHDYRDVASEDARKALVALVTGANKGRQQLLGVAGDTAQQQRLEERLEDYKKRINADRRYREYAAEVHSDAKMHERNAADDASNSGFWESIFWWVGNVIGYVGAIANGALGFLGAGTLTGLLVSTGAGFAFVFAPAPLVLVVLGTLAMFVASWAMTRFKIIECWAGFGRCIDKGRGFNWFERMKDRWSDIGAHKSFFATAFSSAVAGAGIAALALIASEACVLAIFSLAGLTPIGWLVTAVAVACMVATFFGASSLIFPTVYRLVQKYSKMWTAKRDVDNTGLMAGKKVPKYSWGDICIEMLGLNGHWHRMTAREKVAAVVIRVLGIVLVLGCAVAQSVMAVAGWDADFGMFWVGVPVAVFSGVSFAMIVGSDILKMVRGFFAGGSDHILTSYYGDPNLLITTEKGVPGDGALLAYNSDSLAKLFATETGTSNLDSAFKLRDGGERGFQPGSRGQVM